MFGRLLRSRAAARAGAGVIGAYLRFALATTRWTIEGREHLAPFAAGGPVVAAFWHESLPLMPALWAMTRRLNPERRASVLVSRHRDGRFIGAIMAGFHLAIVHGSSARGRSDRGGPASLRTLLAALSEGSAVVITPDGPRGPRRVAAPGAAQLAARAGAPLLPAAGQTTWRLTLRSWDRMIIPLPFGRGALVCLPPMVIAPDGAEAALPAIASNLTLAAARADALCGIPCRA